MEIDDAALRRLKRAKRLLPPHVRARLMEYGRGGAVEALILSWEDWLKVGESRGRLTDNRADGTQEAGPPS